MKRIVAYPRDKTMSPHPFDTWRNSPESDWQSCVRRFRLQRERPTRPYIYCASTRCRPWSLVLVGISSFSLANAPILASAPSAGASTSHDDAQK